MDAVYTRRVIFTAMRPFLEDADLLYAMTIWQEKYASKTTYAFTQFLSECCRTQALKRNRPALLNAILKTLESAEQNLLRDPLNAQTSQFDILMTNQTQYVDANVVFVQFVENLLKNLGGDLEVKTKAYLMKHVGAKLKLNTPQAFALKTWAYNNAATLDASFDNKQKQIMINILYIAICEYIGPIKADQLLATAVRQTEQLAITHQVDLHDYL
jgi:hypothetical protein